LFDKFVIQQVCDSTSLVPRVRSLTSSDSTSSQNPNVHDISFIKYPSEIALHPTKEILYVSNRGKGAIFVYDISKRGFSALKFTLLDLGNPRHFTLSPDQKFMVLKTSNAYFYLF